MTGPRRRALAQPLGIVVLASIASAVATRGLLHRQAKVARATIGKPLGERAHRADGAYKAKHGRPIQLLLLGDSIAAGLGAERPEDTLGAQLARRLAKATRRTVVLLTEAHVGSETSMLRAQLANLPTGYRADVAVIVVGGNDVTHRVRTPVSLRHLTETVHALQQASTSVVVGTCPDLGALAALPQPLRAIVSRSSRQLSAAQRQAVTQMGGWAVSLTQVVGPFFIAQPDDMFAIDRFHPSGAGYRRTAKAMLPSVLAALGYGDRLPHGHYGKPPPAPTVT